MPIYAEDIEFHFSGGGTPATSLGGAIHANTITTATLHNLFDVVTSAETFNGDTEYRCFYVKNAHGSLPLLSAEIWIETDTPAAGSDVAIALGSAGKNGTEQTIVDENIAPTAVSWETGSSHLVIGNLSPNEYYPVWVRRTITAGAAAYSNDSCTLIVRGDTAG